MMKKEEQALLIFERKSWTNRELEEMSIGENTVKWRKGQRIKLVRSPREIGGG